MMEKGGRWKGTISRSQFLVTKKPKEFRICLFACLLVSWIHGCPNEVRILLVKTRREIDIRKVTSIPAIA